MATAIHAPLDRSLFNHEQFEHTQKLMGDRFSLIVNLFFSESQKHMALLESAIQDEDIQAVHLSAHTLKSCNQPLGLMHSVALAGEMERMTRAIKNGKSYTIKGDIAPIFETFKREHQKSEAALKAYSTTE